MGERGPIPKRSEARRRRNKPARELKKAPQRGAKVPCPECGDLKTAGAGMTNHRRRMHGLDPSAEGLLDADHPGRHVADPEWHPVAVQWYDSLAASGQCIFYEPSDWSTAYLIAESISRELAPQSIFNDTGTEVAKVSRPPKGASLAAWLKGMSSLLVTEGDRRRMQVELQRPADEAAVEEVGSVSSIDAWRSRVDGTG